MKILSANSLWAENSLSQRWHHRIGHGADCSSADSFLTTLNLEENAELGNDVFQNFPYSKIINKSINWLENFLASTTSVITLEHRHEPSFALEKIQAVFHCLNSLFSTQRRKTSKFTELRELLAQDLLFRHLVLEFIGTNNANSG